MIVKTAILLMKKRGGDGMEVLSYIDYEMAEWGYFSLKELCELKVSFVEVDRDLHFEPRKALEIETIRKAQGW